MGFRAHQRVKSQVSYSTNACFNWLIDSICDYIDSHIENANVINDVGCPKTEWEIPVYELKQHVEELKVRNLEDELPDLKDYKVKDLIEIFEDWLNTQEKNKDNIDYPEFIYIDWF